jgi:hypothetical protein
MPDYIRFIIFFFLGIIENLINFIFSIIHIYPRVDIQYLFWNATNKAAKKKFLNKLKKHGKNIS